MIYILLYITSYYALYFIILERQNKQKKQVESIFAPPSPTCRGIVFFDSKAIFENIQK